MIVRIISREEGKKILLYSSDYQAFVSEGMYHRYKENVQFYLRVVYVIMVTLSFARYMNVTHAHCLFIWDLCSCFHHQCSHQCVICMHKSMSPGVVRVCTDFYFFYRILYVK